MLLSLFFGLKEAKIPVSLQEHMILLTALKKECAHYSLHEFYYLSRAILIKNEKYIDRFDLVFSHIFKGIGDSASMEEIAEQEIPKEWLEKLVERFLDDEEKAKIQALGGFENLMETLKKRLDEQQGRHQGGSKWIGTAGTSPFGAYGYNPEGVRIGQNESRYSVAACWR